MQRDQHRKKRKEGREEESTRLLQFYIFDGDNENNMFTAGFPLFPYLENLPFLPVSTPATQAEIHTTLWLNLHRYDLSYDGLFWTLPRAIEFRTTIGLPGKLARFRYRSGITGFVQLAVVFHGDMNTNKTDAGALQVGSL